MLRTNSFVISILFCFLLSNPSLGRADFGSPGGSADGVDKEFSSKGLHADDAEKEFSRTQAPVNTESPSAHSENPSVGSIIKNILTPDSAATFQAAAKASSNVKTRVHNLDIGAEVAYYRYQEPNPVGITNQGPMYGYNVEYTYRPVKGNILNNPLTNVYSLQARNASSRDLEYKGSGVVKNKHDDATELRALIGKDYFIGKDTMVTPYFGFGYRYLLDRGNGEDNGQGFGYDRKSHYYYLPLGGDVLREMPNNWAIDLNAEYDIFLQGYQKSFTSDGEQFNNGQFIPDLVNHQDHGFGVRGSIKFIKRGSLADFYVEPYIRYWNIQQSKLVTATIAGQFSNSWNEPNNNTVEVGSKFGVEF